MSAVTKSFYDLKAKTLTGKDFDFNTLKGKVVVVVNVASKCGLTPQYKDLEALYEKYHAQGLEILGFPCNQFSQQEPGGENEIAEFCEKNYGVKFTMMQKIDVNGDNTHEVYNFLKPQATFLGTTSIKWNFEKFLVDRKGKVVDRWISTSNPMKMVPEIETALKESPSL
eukprot:c1086_g1_i1.p1 GENE.c1086_g1_i1~~c1086_g1_i1.p1  ORF type:complete len:169 (+),score=2.92 c1086_g1_i1:47-553(+)